MNDKKQQKSKVGLVMVFLLIVGCDGYFGDINTEPEGGWIVEDAGSAGIDMPGSTDMFVPDMERIEDTGLTVKDKDMFSVDMPASEDMPDFQKPLCKENQKVVSGKCEVCPAGSTRLPGDDPAGSNTVCNVIKCKKDQRVSSNRCVDCPSDQFRTEGDLATGPDTSCVALSFTNIQAGKSHTCAITSLGGVKCWGANNVGQLGNGTTRSSLVPVDVLGLTSGIGQLSTYDSHTCAVTNKGALKCWGYNEDGEIGDGTNENRLVPADVSGLGSGVVQVVTGSVHTCAIVSTGGVKCWGSNLLDRLGAPTSGAGSLIPIDVTGIGAGASDISLGFDDTCAVVASGLKCWGDQGPMAGTYPGTPSDITSVTAGAGHTCYLSGGDTPYCFGANERGQVGGLSTNDSSTKEPVLASGLFGFVKQIDAGDAHTCAVTKAGGVKCWGLNTQGQVGDDSNVNKYAPVDVLGLSSGYVQVSAGANHSCAVGTAGQAKCWGQNDKGQLGNNSVTLSKSPVDVLLP